MRELLIDAYNVMFAHPEIGPLLRRDLEAARERFLAFAAQNRPAHMQRIVVVFDAHRAPPSQTMTGPQKPRYERGVHVVYATETADAWIQAHIRNHTDPQQLTVITSDREILHTAVAHGANVLRVRTFLQLPGKRQKTATKRDSEKPSHIGKRELEQWEQLFENRSRSPDDSPDIEPDDSKS